MKNSLLDKITDTAASHFMNLVKATGKGLLQKSYDSEIRLGRDVAGQDYLLTGGALCVARTDGSLEVLHEDSTQEQEKGLLQRFKENHPVAYTTLKVAGVAAVGAAILAAAGCDNGNGGPSGNSGEITNLQVTTSPLQVDPGEAAILGGTADNADDIYHNDSEGNFVGENEDPYTPHAGINNLVLVAENLTNTEQLPYTITGKYKAESAEEQDSPADFASQPDLIDANEWDFWAGQLSAQAQSELTAIEDLINPSYEEPVAWGVNSDGIYVQSEILDDTEIQGYSDSNGDSNPDYVLRVTPTSFPTLSDATITELENLLDGVPNGTETKQLIEDYLTHIYASVTIDQDLAAYFLPLTGMSIPVTVNAQYDLSGGPVEANFTRDPSAADRADIEAEQNLNGQVAGNIYTGVSADIVEPTNTRRELIDTVKQTIEYHEQNQ